jgi:hypothetical protein
MKQYVTAETIFVLVVDDAEPSLAGIVGHEFITLLGELGGVLRLLARCGKLVFRRALFRRHRDRV